jgi:hypothetical protein
MNKKLNKFMLLGFLLLSGIFHLRPENFSAVQSAKPDENEVFEEISLDRGFDFSAMDKIWEIISILERDEEPPEEAWTDLIRTPGYAALVLHEPRYGLDFVKQNLRLVFKPSMGDELKKGSESRSVRHFLEFKEKSEAIRDFQVQMQNPSVQEEAMALLKPWFPQGVLDGCEPAPSAFILFDKDARGGYGLLIFDILYAMEQGEGFIPLFAHEAFHYYRGKTEAYDEGDLLITHEYILMAIDMIQNEGMADQIDKVSTLFEGGSRCNTDYAVRYRKNMAETPGILGRLDDCLCRLTEDNPDYGKIGSEMISAVPMSGHPTGYFMTRAILKSSGKEELVRIYNNPFAFFYLYNIAALKDTSLPRLSNGAILGLYELEKKVISQPETKLAAEAVVSGVDLSAVDCFRRITAILMQDKDPDLLLWDAFFRNPGYRALFKNESYFSREQITDLITLVFRPSREDELNAALSEGGSYMLNNFISHKKEMSNVMHAVEQWRDGTLFKKTVDQVRTLLPRKCKEDFFPPSLSFIYFNGDVRYGFSVMVADPIWRIESPETFLYYLKAYLIYVHADRVRSFNGTDLTKRQHAFVNGLKRIQQLGFCDLLAMEDGTLKEMDMYSRYQSALPEFPQRIGELDAVLARAESDLHAWKEFNRIAIGCSVRPGYPVGYRMASIIQDILGRDALAESLGNPFAFVRQYQKAALKKGNLPLFSAESMNYIARLESECCRLDQNSLN